LSFIGYGVVAIVIGLGLIMGDTGLYEKVIEYQDIESCLAAPTT